MCVTVLVGRRLYTSHDDVVMYRFLKGQIITSIEVLMKYHDLMMICDITEHILPYNSAKEGLINYSIFKKTLHFSVL